MKCGRDGILIGMLEIYSMGCWMELFWKKHVDSMG